MERSDAQERLARRKRPQKRVRTTSPTGGGATAGPADRQFSGCPNVLARAQQRTRKLFEGSSQVYGCSVIDASMLGFITVGWEAWPPHTRFVESAMIRQAAARPAGAKAIRSTRSSATYAARVRSGETLSLSGLRPSVGR